MSQKINGKQLAAPVRQAVKAKIKGLGFTPGLAVILVGSDPASHRYVALKEQACREAGIHLETLLHFATTPQKKILAQINKLNQRPDIHGIIVQLPLPGQLDENQIIRAIDPAKDVDGFHPANIQKLLRDEKVEKPVLIKAVLRLLAATAEPLAGKNALIIANSPVFTQPMVKVLATPGLVVKTTKPNDPALGAKAAGADVLIVAAGRPRLITADMIKPGAIVIDIGINDENGKLVGDVDPQAVAAKAKWYTPVPGGVGPMTVAMLLENTLALAERQKK